MQTLEMERTYRVVLPPVEELTVVLVGVGGTGSLLASSLARLTYHLRQKGVTVKLLFVDHDVVERRNVLRQNFVASEVGCFKVDALSYRLNAAFGLDISAVPALFTAGRFVRWTAGSDRRGGANLLISAVDNHLARREIAEAVAGQNGRWWCLDLGNEFHSGQVLLGNVADVEAIRFDPMGLCSGLPSPYVQESALLKAPLVEADPLSCAALTQRSEQSLVVNQMAAAIAAQYCCDFLVRRELRQFASYFSLEPVNTQSRLILRSTLAAACPRETPHLPSN
jgi:PRTRC genetic system ThiF family protein